VGFCDTHERLADEACPVCFHLAREDKARMRDEARELAADRRHDEHMAALTRLADALEALFEQAAGR
jgi:hypothetical protein